jgi:uncharacterized protein YecE (DUF72 family)
MQSDRLHIGTSGWSYKHWSGVFYPKELKPAAFLEFYSASFHCVELNASFYNLPMKVTVAGWMNRTPGTFCFCPKMSRVVTHQLRLTNANEPLQKFYNVFEIMKTRLGPVLVQLPPGLSYDKSRISDFLELLKDSYSTFKCAVEVRNKSWITDSFFDLLAQYGVAFVIADSGKRFPFYEVVTTGFVYLRFHGHEHLYASDYGEKDLHQYAEKITNWLNEGKEIWAFFNNDFHGYAVKNALQLKKLIMN